MRELEMRGNKSPREGSLYAAGSMLDKPGLSALAEVSEGYVRYSLFKVGGGIQMHRASDR